MPQKKLSISRSTPKARRQREEREVESHKKEKKSNGKK